MDIAITYDDRLLQRLWDELDERSRVKALKGAFRTEAKRVRAVAKSNLLSSGLNVKAGQASRCIRTTNPRRGTAGYLVTVKTQSRSTKSGVKAKGFYRTARGVDKPILPWAELGTATRSTGVGSRRAHNTGAMRAYGFMSKTAAQTLQGSADAIHDAMRDQIIKIAKRNGCI